jgi:hypothetical protein
MGIQALWCTLHRSETPFQGICNDLSSLMSQFLGKSGIRGNPNPSRGSWAHFDDPEAPLISYIIGAFPRAKCDFSNCGVFDRPLSMLSWIVSIPARHVTRLSKSSLRKSPICPDPPYCISRPIKRCPDYSDTPGLRPDRPSPFAFRPVLNFVDKGTTSGCAILFRAMFLLVAKS